MPPTAHAPASERARRVPRSARERIFTPFERLDDSLTEGAAGTGIGLGIARDLARLHGGNLVLVPTEAGACFEVTLTHPTPETAS